MRHRKFFGFLFLIISIISLVFSFNLSLTGNVIGTNTNISYLYVISLTFFIFSILVFTSRQTLDAILIPTGDLSPELKRTRKALAKGRRIPNQIYMITGRIDNPRDASGENYRVYKKLREHGVPVKDIKIEGKSANTLENVLFSMEKLKRIGAHDIGIASYSTHLDRFEYVINRAKEEGIIDRDFRVHRLEVPSTWGEQIYGVVSNLLYKYELRKGLKNVERPWFHKPIKKVLDYFARKSREKTASEDK